MNWPDLEDHELAALAAKGDDEAFRQIVLRFERPVYALVLRMVRDPTVAEDVAQDAFVKAYSNLHRFDASYRFSSWLFKIAHNTAIDLLRHRRHEPVSLDASGDDERSLADRVRRRRSPTCPASTAKCSCYASRRVGPTKKSAPPSPCRWARSRRLSTAPARSWPPRCGRSDTAKLPPRGSRRGGMPLPPSFFGGRRPNP